MDDVKAVAASFARLYRYLVVEACVTPKGGYDLLHEIAAGTEPASLHTHGTPAQASLVEAARAAYAAQPSAAITTWHIAEDCVRDAASAGRICRRTGLAYALSESGRRVLVHALAGSNPATLRKVGVECARRHAVDRNPPSNTVDVEIQVVPEAAYTLAGLPPPDLSRPSYREPDGGTPRGAPAPRATLP